MDGRLQARQCIAISKVISGGSEQRLILTTESKVRTRAQSRGNISESFFPAGGGKTRDKGRRTAAASIAFFRPRIRRPTDGAQKKFDADDGTGREREVLLYFRFFFLSSVPANERKVDADGMGPLKTKV